jgi:iron complex outermembrane receptor protein
MEDPMWSASGDDLIPFVLTPARLKQPTAEVPASVTVIDRDLIEAVGAQEVSELLRYVPGMLVAPEPLNNTDNVVYHGGTALVPTDMEVLIDGRAIYRAGLSSVTWSNLPVAVEEIQRIEVVRGPNSTAYGTNAYKAVINIITMHPEDTAGDQKINLTLGNNGYQHVHLQSGFEALGGFWRVTGVDRGTDHLDDGLDPERFGCSNGDDCADRRDSRFANVRGFYALPHGDSLDVALVASSSQRSVPDFDLDSNKVREAHHEIGFRYTSLLNEAHELKLSLYGTQYRREQTQRLYEGIAGAFDPELGALYRLNSDAAMQVVSGQQPTALDTSDPEQVALFTTLAQRYADPADFLIPVNAISRASTTEKRVDIELQDTYSPTSTLTVLSGIGFRYDNVYSYDYYKGEIDQTTSRIFANVNWHATDDWVLHSGAMAEISESYSPAKSFRAAANYLISPVQSFRLVYSQAAKTPDLIKEYAQWSYGVDYIETESPYATGDFYASFIADGGLDAEMIYSYELGYYGQSQLNGKAEWDIRLFREKLDGAHYLYPSIWADRVYSDNCIRYTGVEWQAEYQLSASSGLRTNGAYIQVDIHAEEGLSDGELLGMYAPFSQTLSWNQRWTSGLNSTLSLMVVEDMGEAGGHDNTVDFRRLNATVYGVRKAETLDVNWRLSLQRDFTSDPYLPGGASYTQATRVQATLGTRF